MGHGHGDEAGTFGSQTRDAIITFQFKAVHVHNRATSDTLGEFGCDTHQALQKELEDRRKGKRVPKVPAGGSVFTGVGQALTHAHGTSGGGGGIGGGSGIGAGSNGDGDDGAGSGAGSSHGGDRPDRRVTQFMWFHDKSEAPSISGSQTVKHALSRAPRAPPKHRLSYLSSHTRTNTHPHTHTQVEIESGTDHLFKATIVVVGDRT